MVAADHVLFDDTHHCLQMDDDNEHDTIVMQDEDEAEVKEEDEQELIILPFMGTCSKQIRGFSNKNGCMVIPVSKAQPGNLLVIAWPVSLLHSVLLLLLSSSIQYWQLDILFCSITPTNLGQFSKPGTDLNSWS